MKMCTFPVHHLSNTTDQLPLTVEMAELRLSHTVSFVVRFRGSRIDVFSKQEWRFDLQ
jgi:hypothetical protein